MSLKSNNKDLLQGPLVKNMLMFTIPVILSGILQLVFNTADLIVVGKFDTVNGSLAQAAIGSTSAVINLIIGIFLGISVGVNVVIAQIIGSKNFDHLRKAVQTAMLLGFIAGAFIAVLGFIFTKPMLQLIGTEENVLPFAEDYLRIYFIGAPFNMIYNFGAAIMRAYGDTKRPMFFLAFGGVANVILNLITVVGFNMSVRGVAIATASSHFIAAALTVGALIKTSQPIKLHLNGIKLNSTWVKQIIALGVPAGIQSSLFSLSNVVIQSAINSFNDSSIIAGNGNAANVEGFLYLATHAFYQTIITFMGQCCGARRFEMLKKIYYTGIVLVGLAGLVTGFVAWGFDRQLMTLYSSNKADIVAGMMRLSIICPTYFICGLMDYTAGAIRGMGKSFVPMIISLIGACGLRVVWVFTVFKFWNTTTSLYISYPISWLLTFIALFIYTTIVRRNMTQGERVRQLAKQNS